VLYTDHDSFRYIQSQKKLNARHARWVDYLQQFTFVLKHKAGSENRVADALSRRSHLLTSLTVTVTGFEEVKRCYPGDPDFGLIYAAVLPGPTTAHPHYTVQDGYLFFKNRLCLPNTSTRDFVIQEMHEGGLASHFGRDKTISLVEDRFVFARPQERCYQSGPAMPCLSISQRAEAEFRFIHTFTRPHWPMD
jgi:hypothetical protein